MYIIYRNPCPDPEKHKGTVFKHTHLINKNIMNVARSVNVRFVCMHA